MNPFLIILLLVSFFSFNVNAETMRGGSYTLNGSVDVMVNQSQGGSYILNPNGDSIAPNSNGGTFVLYPTPYSKPDPVVTAVIRGVIYGSSDPTSPYYTVNSTTTPQRETGNNTVNNNPRNPNDTTNVGVDGGNSSGNYNEEGEFIPGNTETNYGYFNKPFGSSDNGKNSTTSETLKKGIPSFVTTFFSWLLLILLILLILRRIWRRLQGNA